MKSKRQRNIENKQYSWYGKPCVVCGRPIQSEPCAQNMYDQVGVEGIRCGNVACELEFGTEKYKQLWWTCHNLAVLLNPSYWGEGVAEKVWQELMDFAEKEYEPAMPSALEAMRKYPILEMAKIAERLKAFLSN